MYGVCELLMKVKDIGRRIIELLAVVDSFPVWTGMSPNSALLCSITEVNFNDQDCRIITYFGWKGTLKSPSSNPPPQTGLSATDQLALKPSLTLDVFSKSPVWLYPSHLLQLLKVFSPDLSLLSIFSAGELCPICSWISLIRCFRGEGKVLFGLFAELFHPHPQF